MRYGRRKGLITYKSGLQVLQGDLSKYAYQQSTAVTSGSDGQAVLAGIDAQGQYELGRSRTRAQSFLGQHHHVVFDASRQLGDHGTRGRPDGFAQKGGDRNCQIGFLRGYLNNFFLF